MGEYKTKIGVYSAWNYELEIEDLNRASKEGWQLVKGRSFSHKYRRDTGVQYRYQLDFQPGVEDMGRYIETYREQGWEYINSTFNGWHYFRKLYDPSLPEEHYEIFTDMASFNEMNRRWSIIATIIAIFLGIYTAVQAIFMICQPKLPTLFGLITYGIPLVIFIRAIRIMKNPEGNRKQRKDGWILLLLFASLLIGPVIYFNLQDSRPRVSMMLASSEYHEIPEWIDEETSWQKFSVSYPDFYYMEFQAEADAPFTISVLNEDMETVYTAKATESFHEEKRVWLDTGSYAIYFTDFAGGEIEVRFNIE